jgi:hypothetical protein
MTFTLLSLLPPWTAASTSHGNSKHLPSPSLALLGPLPPTSVFHLALNYLTISNDYERQIVGNSQSVRKRNVLVITGPRAEMHDWLEEEDEAWMRDYSGEYGIIDKLKRINIKCVSG